MAETSRFLAALTEAVVPTEGLGLSAPELEAALTETAGFVEGQVEALPPRLALMFAVGTAVFRFHVRMTHLRSFCGLGPEARRRVVEKWAYGRIPLFRALFKLVRSTALLVFFEVPAVKSALDRRGGPTAQPAVEAKR